MKIIVIVFLLLSISLAAYFFALGFKSKSKIPPGLHENRLSSCPDKPNCICTEFKTDTAHYLQPIRFAEKDFDVVMPTAQRAINSMGGTIVFQNKRYIAATFTSNVFGFVDDFEIRLDPNEYLLHFRSASRVGTGDLGINKKRAEQFIQHLNTNLPNAE